MKKIFALLLAVVMTLGLLAGCGTAAETPDTEAPATEAPAAEEPAAETTAKKIDTLKVAFVPSREPQEIITVTEPLKEMLKNELAALGYEVGEVEITVGTTYEAVGEGLEAGTIDVGLIPGGTYVLYDDGAEVILTATRDGLSKDSDNAKDWNDGQPTEASDRQAVSYRALFIAGPSEKGKELAGQGQRRGRADLGRPRRRQLERHGHVLSRRLHLPRSVAAGPLRQGHLGSRQRRAV